MDRWMDRQMDTRWMDGWIMDGQMDRQVDDRWKDAGMHACMMDGW